MSVLETVLTLVVPTVGLYLLIALLVVAPRLARRPRYRVGQPRVGADITSEKCGTSDCRGPHEYVAWRECAVTGLRDDNGWLR